MQYVWSKYLTAPSYNASTNSVSTASSSGSRTPASAPTAEHKPLSTGTKAKK